MAINGHTSLFLVIFICLLLSSNALLVPSSSKAIQDHLQTKANETNLKLERMNSGAGRRLMIGSMAPHCTYNECRGCRFRCRAEQVPVDANDPMNSAYRYRCVCYR